MASELVAPTAALDAFLEELRAAGMPEIAVIIDPYRAMSDDNSMAELLDQLALMWGRVRAPREKTT